MIQQVSVFLENSKGRLAELARSLGDADVNMHSLTTADTDEFGVIRIICDAPVRAAEVLRENGFTGALTDVIAVEAPDRPGGLADILETLDAAGVGIEYSYCFIAPGAGAADILKVHGDHAEQVLVDAGFRVYGPRDLYVPDAR